MLERCCLLFVNEDQIEWPFMILCYIIYVSMYCVTDVFVCVFSADEAARLSSVAVSADIIKAASLPLQLNHSPVDKSNVSLHQLKRKIHKHNRPAHDFAQVTNSVSNELHDSAGEVNSSDQGCRNKSHKRKHKRPAEVTEVNKSGSKDFSNSVDNASDMQHKVTDSVSNNRRHKHKYRRTADVSSVLSTDE